MALEKILDVKRRELAGIKQKAIDILPGLEPSKKSLAEALRPDGQGPFSGRAVIMECKKASPSKGLIREDFDLSSILSSYAPFASAVSVLTDHHFFQGSFDYLRMAAETLKQPVLCKDFILDPAQVQWARHHGADAILLMLSVLDDETYRTCAAEAKKWNLDILTEVHSEIEVKRALDLGASIIGINNRNLKDLSIDLRTTAQLASLIPTDRIIVSESGFHTHAELRSYRGTVDGFLVGSSLMQENSLDQAIRELLFGKVKVCGLCNVADAGHAYESGAIFGGMILGAKSPRKIELSMASKLVESTPLKWVGVFQNTPVETIKQAATTLGLTAVQLHGQEDNSSIASLREALPQNIQIWKVHSLEWDEPIPELWPSPPIDRYLLDRRVKAQSGGTGERLNWDQLTGVPSRREAILAGGLKAETVTNADQLDMWGLDVSSGLEFEPGKKDPQKIHTFFEQLRGGTV